MHGSTRILKALRKAGLGKGPSFVIDPKTLARANKRYQKLVKAMERQERGVKKLKDVYYKGVA